MKKKVKKNLLIYGMIQNRNVIKPDTTSPDYLVAVIMTGIFGNCRHESARLMRVMF